MMLIQFAFGCALGYLVVLVAGKIKNQTVKYVVGTLLFFALFLIGGGISAEFLRGGAIAQWQILHNYGAAYVPMQVFLENKAAQWAGVMFSSMIVGVLLRWGTTRNKTAKA